MGDKPAHPFVSIPLFYTFYCDSSIEPAWIISYYVLPADGAVPLTEVSPGFTASLDQLRGIIAEHLTTPHTFGGEPITGGQRLHDIVGGLCEMVNSTGDICPLRFGKFSSTTHERNLVYSSKSLVSGAEGMEKHYSGQGCLFGRV